MCGSNFRLYQQILPGLKFQLSPSRLAQPPIGAKLEPQPVSRFINRCEGLRKLLVNSLAPSGDVSHLTALLQPDTCNYLTTSDMHRHLQGEQSLTPVYLSSQHLEKVSHWLISQLQFATVRMPNLPQHGQNVQTWSHVVLVVYATIAAWQLQVHWPASVCQVLLL